MANVSALINRTATATIPIVSMLLAGCTHNIAVQSLPNFSNTQAEKIKTKTLLVIPDSLGNYVYRGTGSTPEFPGLPSDTWVFPVGKPTSDLLRKGIPLIFQDVEVAAESPLANDPKGRAYGLILKPSIESFDFGLGPPSWVRIKYKLEARDLNGKVVFSEIVAGRGENRGSLDKAANNAVQSGVNLLLDNLSRMSLATQRGAEAPR